MVLNIGKFVVCTWIEWASIFCCISTDCMTSFVKAVVIATLPSSSRLEFIGCLFEFDQIQIAAVWKSKLQTIKKFTTFALVTKRSNFKTLTATYFQRDPQCSQAKTAKTIHWEGKKHKTLTNLILYFKIDSVWLNVWKLPCTGPKCMHSLNDVKQYQISMNL